MYIYIYIITGLFFLISITIIDLLYKYLNRKQIIHFVEKFADYIAILNYHMEKAYEIIHKDKMLIYSVEATKVTEREFNQYAKEFAVLVMQLLGPTLEKEFIKFYGNEETFYFNLIEYFNTKYEGDEVRESAVSNLMEQD